MWLILGPVVVFCVAMCAALIHQGTRYKQASIPEAIVQCSNTNIQLQLVLEHDDIKVYRFYDGHQTIYYTDARGGTQWEERHSTGKSLYYIHRSVDTVQ